MKCLKMIAALMLIEAVAEALAFQRHAGDCPCEPDNSTFILLLAKDKPESWRECRPGPSEIQQCNNAVKRGTVYCYQYRRDIPQHPTEMVGCSVTARCTDVQTCRGTWSQWASEGNCNTECGLGLQVKVRICYQTQNPSRRSTLCMRSDGQEGREEERKNTQCKRRDCEPSLGGGFGVETIVTKSNDSKTSAVDPTTANLIQTSRDPHIIPTSTELLPKDERVDYAMVATVLGTVALLSASMIVITVIVVRQKRKQTTHFIHSDLSRATSLVAASDHQHNFNHNLAIQPSFRLTTSTPHPVSYEMAGPPLPSRSTGDLGAADARYLRHSMPHHRRGRVADVTVVREEDEARAVVVGNRTAEKSRKRSATIQAYFPNRAVIENNSEGYLGAQTVVNELYRPSATSLAQDLSAGTGDRNSDEVGEGHACVVESPEEVVHTYTYPPDCSSSAIYSPAAAPTEEKVYFVIEDTKREQRS